jgi:hypothetical protein
MSTRFQLHINSTDTLLSLRYDTANQEMPYNDINHRANQDFYNGVYGHFTKIFKPKTTKKMMAQVLLNKMKKQCLFVFGYGCSGAGKTYTLIGNEKENGILTHIMNIHIENLKSLYEPDSVIIKTYVTMNEYCQNNAESTNHTMILATCDEIIRKTLLFINKERKVRKTLLNPSSSRSHCTVIIKFEVVRRTLVAPSPEKTENNATNAYSESIEKSTFIVLGDFAGREVIYPMAFFRPSLLDGNRSFSYKNLNTSPPTLTDIDKFYEILPDKQFFDIVSRVDDMLKLKAACTHYKSTNKPLYDYVHGNIGFAQVSGAVKAYLNNYKDQEIISKEGEYINKELDALQSHVYTSTIAAMKKIGNTLYAPCVNQKCYEQYITNKADTTEHSDSSNIYEMLSRTLKEQNNGKEVDIQNCIFTVINVSPTLDKEIIVNKYVPLPTSTTSLTDSQNPIRILNQSSLIGTLEYTDQFSKLFTIKNTCNISSTDLGSEANLLQL